MILKFTPHLICRGSMIPTQTTPPPDESKYTDKLKDQLYWWLGKNRPFIINGEYKLELLNVDSSSNSAKILITNLKKKEGSDGQR